MSNVPQIQALTFDQVPANFLAGDQRSSFYSNLIRRNVLIGSYTVLDPDIVLDSDPEAYLKILNELGLSAKFEKRTTRSAGADWFFQAEGNPECQEKCQIFEAAFRHIKGFTRSRRTLLRSCLLKGWGISRIQGKYIVAKFPGDTRARRWWVPTRLLDLPKERMRVQLEEQVRIDQGYPRYYWSIQDIMTFRWYRMRADAPPGLRREDHVWLKYNENEEDLGYASGLGKMLYHRWFMLTFFWSYAAEGAENWARGKVVVTVPQIYGGHGVNAEQGQKTADQIKEDVANKVEKSMGRHVLVLDAGQEYQLVDGPQRGAEAVQWLIDRVNSEAEELILGRRPEDNPEMEPDMEIINSDRDLLEEAIDEDLVRSFIKWNRHNFADMGMTQSDLDCIHFRMRRDKETDPQAAGKVFLTAAAMGAPIDAEEFYDKMALTKPAGAPEVLWAPPPGSPVEGTMAEVKTGTMGDTPPKPEKTPAPQGPRMSRSDDEGIQS